MLAWLRRQWIRFKAWAYAALVAIGIIAAPILVAGTRDVSWTNATDRVDGTPFDASTEQAEIRVYCDGNTSPAGVFPGASTQGTLTLPPGMHTCYGTTVDVNGLESTPSNSISFEVLLARPSPPVLFDSPG